MINSPELFVKIDDFEIYIIAGYIDEDSNFKLSEKISVPFSKYVHAFTNSNIKINNIRKILNPQPNDDPLLSWVTLCKLGIDGFDDNENLSISLSVLLFSKGLDGNSGTLLVILLITESLFPIFDKNLETLSLKNIWLL